MKTFPYHRAAIAACSLMAAVAIAQMPPQQPDSLSTPATKAAEGHLIVTYNNTGSPMWVTVYRQETLGETIVQSGCVDAKGERGWPISGRSYRVRAQMTRLANCQGITDCDTSGAFDVYPGKKTSMKLQATAQGCWWD